MSWGPAAISDQRGRVAVVTGATRGLGAATACELARAGATVVVTARHEARGEAARADILRRLPDADVEVVTLDLTSLASVAACTEELAARHPRIDVLVNNAGVMATPFARTAEGFELQIGTNHLGPFALTARLLPLLDAAPAGRVVTVASLAHLWGDTAFDVDDLSCDHRRYLRWLAYGHSKLANLLFTFELERRLVAAGSRTRALAAHPGLVRTGLGKGGGDILAWLQTVGMWLATPMTQSVRRGAHPQLRAATDPDLPGGTCVGPGGLGQRRGPAVVVGCSSTARDPALAAALWARSAALTGVDLPR